MCGIAGIFAAKAFPSDIQMVTRGMIRQLIHRGPDDEGVWSDSSYGLSLAHRRLSILDLSEAGHQPMLSHCGRYAIVFNGEIYNHQVIRKELNDERKTPNNNGWRGHSDTETLLTAISYWGLQKTLDKAVGMFAFALWDREEKTLQLVRDRIGEKPLYYGLYNGTLLFASELKAIRAYPGFQSEVDRYALTQFLRLNAIPAPLSIYKGIFKLPAGTSLRITQENIFKRELAKPKPYWSMLDVAVNGQNNPFNGTTAEACDELERLLKQSISGQMLADVTVGAFLSGGVDSSAVASLMQAQSTRPVKTFTMGFHENDYDEALHARAVANHLGTEHTELYVTAEQALAVIPRLPKLYDEPFADASQIPTFLISEFAQSNVAVCLSGDGGDELFGGYNRYVSGARIWRSLGWLPQSVRTNIAAGINAAKPSTWDFCLNRFGSMLPREWRLRTPGVKMQKVAEMLTANSPQEVYLRLVSHWSNSEEIVLGEKQNADFHQKQLRSSLLPELEHQMMYMDSLTYLADDILVKVDRAAMGVSLETRVPMLDHRVVEFAWSLPLDMKIRDYEGKWLLRQLLDRYIPRALIERPKAGFSVPIGSWLRGPLREWAEELLNSSKLEKQGFFAPVPIRAKWEEHLNGKRDWSSQLWSILMFQAWLNEQ